MLGLLPQLLLQTHTLSTNGDPVDHSANGVQRITDHSPSYYNWDYRNALGIRGSDKNLRSRFRYSSDPCWALPDEERQDLTEEVKEKLGCRCWN